MTVTHSAPLAEVTEPVNKVLTPSASGHAPMVSIVDLHKHYRTTDGDVHAVRGISFDIAKGEFVTLLGPSGCGKTTILRSVAGLETPTSGAISIGGRVVYSSDRRIRLTPAQRQIGMVFQSYAIWPHMSVFDNVAYPLRRRRLPKAEILSRTTEVLEMLGLAYAAQRPATKLSGGQQQRVAVARALVSRSDLILFDEPLSNLDAKLRKEVRQEIRDLQQRLGITVLYVTHDQEEAMAVSDRILVLEGGDIKDQGTPSRVYSRPADVFAANFVGESETLNGTVVESDNDHWLVQTDIGRLHVARQPQDTVRVSDAVVLTVRPEHLQLRDPVTDTAIPTIAGSVRSASFLGPFAELVVELESGHLVTARVSGGAGAAPGAPVHVRIEPHHVVLHPDRASRDPAAEPATAA
ncbi:ABC transporter ATP-binding protein [Solwaraspora sp. WMMD406]|uniref:ABC transporter ATP-binding protein n=1 Tax=Solwaraspora sp. WMMD406 TaxID=3016095 RepID=UPI0024165C3D|nr:ABC transporter ATP-binding protein [Solwaraspora sp. WMMD406]MDG4764369.1 ABC transporter ATP-binding protein [Solwaraspora sp. WMMD406]